MYAKDVLMYLRYEGPNIKRYSSKNSSSKNESIQFFNPLMKTISNSNTLSEHLSYQFEKKIIFSTFVRYIVLSNYLPISQGYVAQS